MERSNNGERSRHIEGVVDERLHALDEGFGVRQFGMNVEGRFVRPA
jgi:hypothetical protein